VPKQLRKALPAKNSSRIQRQEFPQLGISFSFKYFQENHDQFSVQNKGANYWTALIERLKALSSLSAEEILLNRSKTLRCHPIRWSDTTESGFGIPNESRLVDTPYQFSLSSNEHGRVHGFFIDEVFYIVWLDPNHCLYR
jgi:hypothetical protein